MVRRLVPGESGPTGGPAFTDLLGVCESWGPETATIRPASGEPVEIPIALIVSGKPVPPKPSVRHRVSARDAELHAAPLFPGVETGRVGDWTLRWEPAPVGRLRRRANSALAMGDPGLPVSGALAGVDAFYRARGRTPLVQVEQGSPVEEEVRKAGWQPAGGDAVFLLAATAQLSRSLPDPGDVDLSVAGARVWASIGTGCDPLAEGQAGLDGDWLGLHALEVDPDHRRQGLATRLIAALVEWGAEQGARTVWLQVETDNAPAYALYDRLGFSEHHRYRYYQSPED